MAAQPTTMGEALLSELKKISFALEELTKKGAYTVGLVADGTVVIFNTVEYDTFIEFVTDRILPLIKKPRG